MVAHKNFYQTLNEAKMRLRGTIVQYKDDFYYVVDVFNHEDGIFRVYMDRLGEGCVGRDHHRGSFPNENDYHYSPDSLPQKYDKWIEDNPDSGFIRKYANSRHFNQFRPFPLGNVNHDGTVIHCVRTPTRNMHQGMLTDAVNSTRVRAAPSRSRIPLRGLRLRDVTENYNDAPMDCYGPAFHDMLRGLYPSYEEVIENLRDPHISNEGCAFTRDWSVMRGPIGLLILCYQDSGIGLIDGDMRHLIISKEHEFLTEAVQELSIFNQITVKE